MNRTQALDELERQLDSLRTLSDLISTNCGSDGTPALIAGILNLLLDNLDIIHICLLQSSQEVGI